MGKLAEVYWVPLPRLHGAQRRRVLEEPTPKKAAAPQRRAAAAADVAASPEARRQGSALRHVASLVFLFRFAPAMSMLGTQHLRWHPGHRRANSPRLLVAGVLRAVSMTVGTQRGARRVRTREGRGIDVEGRRDCPPPRQMPLCVAPPPCALRN